MTDKRADPAKFQFRTRAADRLFLVLNPDLTIIDASDAYRRSTLLWREEVKGRYILDVFPDNPYHSEADGAKKLRASLQRVMRDGVPHRMAVQRYDVFDRVSADGAWVEKYWRPLNRPVFARGSTEITHLIHEVQDVTRAVALRGWIQENFLAIEEQRSTLQQMLCDLADRERSLRTAFRALAVMGRGQAPLSRTVEEINTLVEAPETSHYFSAGQTATLSALYSVFHLEPCAPVTATVFVRAGSVFPRCPRCIESVLYRVLLRM
jgi:hypothetical protein